MGDLVALPKSEMPERAQKLVRWARETAERRSDMIGFVLLAWDKEGATTFCADACADDNPIPQALLPSYVAELLRRDLVTEREIHRELRDLGILVPTPPDQPA